MQSQKKEKLQVRKMHNLPKKKKKTQLHKDMLRMLMLLVRKPLVSSTTQKMLALPKHSDIPLLKV